MGTFDDHQMGWKLKSVYIPIAEFASALGAAGVDTMATGAGAAVSAVHSLGSSALNCYLIAASGDDANHIMPLPWDMDHTKEVYARIHFVHASTDADTPDWIVSYTLYAKQAALTLCVAGTRDDGVAITHTCSTTDDSYEITKWGALSWVDSYAAGDEIVQWNVECNGISAGANEIELVGFEFLYTVGALGPERKVTSR